MQTALDVLLYGDKFMVYSHKSMDEVAAFYRILLPWNLLL